MNKNMLDVLAAAVASEPSDAPTNQRSKDGLNKINTDLCHVCSVCSLFVYLLMKY